MCLMLKIHEKNLFIVLFFYKQQDENVQVTYFVH